MSAPRLLAFARLAEATPAGPTGREWDVVIIRAGWSDNGNYYPDVVLREAVTLFEGSPVHAFEWGGYFDHVPGAIKKAGGNSSDYLRNRVGTLTSVRFVEGAAENRGRLEARLVFWAQAAALAESLRDEWRAGRREVVGLSIDADGARHVGMAEGRSGHVVDRIAVVDSTELVSQPAAGGRLERLVASRGVGSSRTSQEGIMDMEAILAGLKRRGIMHTVDASWTREQRVAAIRESVDKALAGPVTALRAAFKDAPSARLAENLDLLQAAQAALAAGDVEGAMAAIAKAIADYQVAAADKPKGDAAPEKDKASCGGMTESLAAAKAAREAAEKELGAVRALREGMERDAKAAAKSRRTALVEAKVATSGLPAAAAKRLSATLLARADDDGLTEAAIVEAVGAERDYVANLTAGAGGPLVRGLGARPDGGLAHRDKLQAALDGLFEGRDVGPKFSRTGHEKDVQVAERRLVEGSKFYRPDEDYPTWSRRGDPADGVAGWSGDPVPRFRSLREAYAAFRGVAGADRVDCGVLLKEARGYVEAWIPDRAERIAEARLRESAGVLRESLVSTDWAQAQGDSVTRRMLRLYSLSDLNKWKWIVSRIGDLKDFRTQRRVKIHGFGEAATVTQGSPYPETAAGVPGDEEETFVAAKRGRIVPLTFEMVKNDDIGAIARIPQELAISQLATLHNTVFAFLRDNSALSSDAVALANAAHGSNISTTALSKAQMDVARRTMLAQTRPGTTADTLGLANAPAWLVVPAALEDIAFRLGTSEVFVQGDADANVGPGTKEPNIHRGIKPIVVAEWDATDANNWWTIADPSKQETIEVGFLDGREDPELFVQDDPTQGSMFSADRLGYKARHIWGTGLLDFRPFFGGIVA